MPANEAARLEALRSYSVLDTAPEADFDDLTALAAHICGTPIALVSLVDSNRQWFKSRHGLDAHETNRDVSFCAHTILQPEETLIVPDATADERFVDNPLVTDDPGIRFYAGVSLRTPTGMPIGSLCVIDRMPRNLSDAQLDALRILGRQVIAQLELRQIAEAQARLLTEISTPLIPVSDDVLVMPLIGTIDSRRAQEVLTTLLHGIGQSKARVAILDITGVAVVDTHVANALIQSAQAVQMLGAQVVLTGIRPEVAQTLVSLHVDLSAIVTQATLQRGIQFALQSQRIRAS
jgi:anti-anti-sigma regulatory factor